MAELGEVLLERDFVLLQHYATKRMLPATRVEMMLAQVAKLVVQSQGAMQEATLADFLLRPVEQAEPEMNAEVGAEILAGITGAKVIHLSRKRDT